MKKGSNCGKVRYLIHLDELVMWNEHYFIITYIKLLDMMGVFDLHVNSHLVMVEVIWQAVWVFTVLVGILLNSLHCKI